MHLGTKEFIHYAHYVNRILRLVATKEANLPQLWLPHCEVLLLASKCWCHFFVDMYHNSSSQSAK